MPAPKPIDAGHRMDPSKNGDNHAIKPPSGEKQKPYTNAHGRQIPPSQDHIKVISDGKTLDHMHGIQNGWDRNDHGYHKERWDGHDMWHHYDEFGYHWWGFYIGSVYFWTRYDNDMYWWYDPYWHRWCWMRDNRWWWQDDGGLVYYIGDDGSYDQYQDNDGTIVVTPDPTPPVDVPPGPSEPAAPASFYANDGTRYVTVNADDGTATLYDLTVTDPNDPRIQGRVLATGASSAQFAYDDATAADGTPTQVLRQITLSFTDGTTTAVVDPNGEREITLPGDGTAVLSNLDDSTVDQVTLSASAASILLINQPGQDAYGENEQILQQIVVTQTDGSTVTFDWNGTQVDSTDAPAPAPDDSGNATPIAFRKGAAPATSAASAAQVQTMQQKVMKSPAFQALQNFSW